MNGERQAGEIVLQATSYAMNRNAFHEHASTPIVSVIAAAISGSMKSQKAEGCS